MIGALTVGRAETCLASDDDFVSLHQLEEAHRLRLPIRIAFTKKRVHRDLKLILKGQIATLVGDEEGVAHA